MFQINKKVILIFVIIWISLLIGTYFFAANKMKTSNSVSYIEEEKEESDIDIDEKNYMSYYSLYNENDLICEEVVENNITYIKVSGLIDKKIEKKVNDLLYSKAKEKTSDKDRFTIEEVKGNFSNILSVVLEVGKDSEYALGNASYGINIDLTTGNEIEFTSIFKKNANIKALIGKSYYSQSSLDYGRELLRNGEGEYDENSINPYFPKVDIDNYDAEEVTFKFANYYLNNTSREFYLSNNEVVIILNNENYYTSYNLSLKNNDFIYHIKYLKDKSIFERDNIGKKNLFVSAYSVYNHFISYSNNYEVGDYAFVDFEVDFHDCSSGGVVGCLCFETGEYDKNLSSENTIKLTNNIINDNLKNVDKNKFTYIASTYYKLSSSYILMHMCIYTMDKDYYNNTFKYKIWDSKSSMDFYDGDMIVSDIEDNKAVKMEQNLIIGINGNNIYSSVKDLFKSGVDYDSFLKEYFYDYYEKNYGYKYEFLEEDRSKHVFSYSIFYGGINVTEVNSGNGLTLYNIDEIPKEYLK